MYLHELLAGIDYELYNGNTHINVEEVFYDSRKVSKDSLFVAIKGFKVDGHKYIQGAIDKGANTIIFEDNPRIIDNRITYVKVKNTRSALSKIACNFYDNPSEKINIIGITGTNGKTSISFILQHILSHTGKKTGIIGTIGNYFGKNQRSSTHTTPESLELHGIIKEMVDNGFEYLVMEVSSHAIDLYRIADITFKHAIFTNLTQDHLDFHGSLLEYFNSKKKLFLMSKDLNIVNCDDVHGKILLKELENKNKPILSYGIFNKSDIYAKDIDYSTKGVSFILSNNTIEEKLSCPIPGEFTVYNLLSAISVALYEGIEIEAIKESVKNMPTVPGRVERMNIDTLYDVVIDYAHTPDGLKNVLQALKQYVKGDLITLFGCGGDRDTTKRSIMGKIAGELSDYCIITTDNPRSEEPKKIIDDIIIGIKNTKCKYDVIEDRYEAIKHALNIAKKNDLILLAGKGHEIYQIFKNKTIEFDEKKIVKEILHTNDTN